MKLKRFSTLFGTYALTGVLTIGVIVAFGILSASGMLLLAPSIALAVSAFVFGGVVEGEVFKQEILEGLHDLTLLGKRGYQHLIVHALERYLKSAPVYSGFLFEYFRISRYLDEVSGRQLTDRQKAQKKVTRKRLRHMREYFASMIMSGNGDLESPYANDDELRIAIENIRGQLPVMKRKMVVLRVAIPFSLLCGAGFGFATASALPVALAAISASLGFLVWPLAVIAAIGYTFLIFHTAKEILFSDGFRKWKGRLKKWFTPGSEGVTPLFVFKAAVIGLIATATVALCVMGTLATAGTWWVAVKHGAKLMPYVKTIANVIRNVLAPVAAFGNFIFSLYNSFESIHIIKRTLESARPIRYLKSQWQALRASENWAQILNPFRIICKITQKSADAILLIGHVLASGTARDQFMNVPPTVLAVTTAGSELTQDITFFFEDGKKTTTQWVVSALLSPLLLLAASWQYLASRCNQPEYRVSMMQACKQAFGVTDKPVYVGDDAPPQSQGWRQVEIYRYFNKHVFRLEHAVMRREQERSKIPQFVAARNVLLARNGDRSDSVSMEYKQALMEHGLFVAKNIGDSFVQDGEKIDHSCQNAL